MDQNKRQQDLHLQTMSAFHAVQVQVSEQGKIESTQPGDLVITASSPPGVEWLILLRDGIRHRLFVLPADTQTWIGTNDIEVSDSSTGPLSIRCGLGRWVPAMALSDGRLSGRLPNRDLEQVLEQWRRFRDDRILASMIQQETDRCGSYREWIRETVLPACDALSAMGGHHPQDRENEEAVTPREKAISGRWLSRYAGLAATLLLATTLAFLGGLNWHSDSPPALSTKDPTGAQFEKWRRDSEHTLQELRSRHREELADLALQKDQQIIAQQAKIRALQESLENTTPEPDPPFAILSPADTVRSVGVPLEIDTESDSILLLLLVEDDEPFTSYRVRVSQREGQDPWEADVEKRGLSEILVQLPLAKLDRNGLLECQLLGIVDDQTVVPLHQYVLQLRAPE